MFKKLVHKIMRRHHPWRGMEFDELAEIYTSMTLRRFGFSMVGIFIPVYLYQNGVSLQDIFLYFTIFFFFRIFTSVASAYVIGRIGPKHSIAVSTVLTIVFLLMLLTFNTVRWPLPILALVFTAAGGLFFIAYNTDFSKVKHAKHGGKELAWLNIFQSAGGALGPLIGGIVASLTSPIWTITLAMLVLLGSLIPLFLSAEPVKIHQKITFKRFKFLSHTRDFISVGAMQMSRAASVWLWPLLLAVFIFTDDTYAKIGGLVSIATLVSGFSAYMFGKFIDNRKGYPLLVYGSVMSTIGHVLRSLITTGGGAVALGVMNEPSVLSVQMPLLKGLYDSADHQRNQRIVYLALSETVAAVMKTIFCFGLFMAAYYFDPISVLRASFVVVGLITPLVLTQNFSALKRNSA